MIHPGRQHIEKCFDLCDELGLMVWQDFMFACSMYPATGKWLESMVRSAHNIRRLRNHLPWSFGAGNECLDASTTGAGKASRKRSSGARTRDRRTDEPPVFQALRNDGRTYPTRSTGLRHPPAGKGAMDSTATATTMGCGGASVQAQYKENRTFSASTVCSHSRNIQQCSALHQTQHSIVKVMS